MQERKSHKSLRAVASDLLPLPQSLSALLASDNINEHISLSLWISRFLLPLFLPQRAPSTSKLIPFSLNETTTLPSLEGLNLGITSPNYKHLVHSAPCGLTCQAVNNPSYAECPPANSHLVQGPPSPSSSRHLIACVYLWIPNY